MSIKIKLSEDLEKQLREKAESEGQGIEGVVVDLLKEGLQSSRTDNLNSNESELLQKINIGISEPEWNKYFHLIDKRDAENILDAELEELIALNAKIEQANVSRMKHLIKLAQLRNVELKDLMDELGIHPRSNG